MRLTKLEHACVRLEQDGTTIVVDPGALSGAAAALAEANAVLVTHEHFDHLDEKALRAAVAADPDLEVWTNPAVAAQLGDLGARVHAVTHGASFTVGGLDVHVHGERHAPSHNPEVANVGFLVGGEVFHPGDAFTVPDEPVPTLLLPTTGPWLKAVEVVEYAARLAPRRAYSVHDGLFKDELLVVVDAIMGAAGRAAAAGGTEPDARRLPVGDAVDLP